MIYEGKEVKFIKEYDTYILVEHNEGFKEAIHKSELRIKTDPKRPYNLNPDNVKI